VEDERKAIAMDSRNALLMAEMLSLTAMNEWQPKKSGYHRHPSRSATGTISQDERDRRNRLKKQAKRASKRNR